MKRWRAVVAVLLAGIGGPVLLSGCALGGVASFTAYEPTVPQPAPAQVTRDVGKISTGYTARRGVEGYGTYSASREGLRSLALAYPRYELRIFTTPGKHAGNLALGLVFYIPVPIASGGSSEPYEVRMDFTCGDPAGCAVDPSRMRFVGAEDSGELISRCSGAPLQGEPRADAAGEWRLAPRAGLALSCYVTAGSPSEIVMHLGEAVVIGDGAARAPSVVLRRVVVYDGYF